MPLKQGDQVIGVLNVFDEAEGDFDEDEVRLLSLFAAQAVIAIENARLIEQTRHGREHLKILHKIDQAILAAQSPEEIAQAALGHIRQLVPCERASVVLYNFEANETSVLAVHLNGDTHLPKGQRYVLESSENITNMRQGRPYIVEDIATLAKPSNTDQQLLAEGIRSYISMPLIFRDELIGSFNLGAMEPGTFGQQHIEIAHQVADQLAIAIQQAQLRDAETQRRREAETLREATAVLTSALNLNQVLDNILIQLERVVPYDSTCIFLMKDEYLHAVAGRGFSAPERVLGQYYRAEDDVLFDEIQRTRRPFILADTQDDSRFLRWGDSDEVRGWMGVPLIVSGEVIGHLTLDSRQVAGYGKSEAALAQVFANQAAVAIENAQLFEAEQRQREIAETLGEVASVVNSSLELTAVLNRVLLELEKVIPYDSATIMLLEQDMLRVVAGRGFADQEMVAALSLPLADAPLAINAIDQRKPVLVPDTQQEQFFDPTVPGSAPIRCVIAVPLISREEIIGLLNVDSWTPNRYTVEDADVAFRFAQQVTIAIENARLHTETEQRAEQLAALHELDQAITSSLHIDDVYEAFAQQTLRLFPYVSMLIILLQEGQLHVSFTAGETPLRSIGEILPFRTTGVSGWVVAHNQPLLIYAIANETRFEIAPEVSAKDIQSGMIIPLRIKGQVIGTWNLAHKQTAVYNSNDLAIAQSMADQLVIAIENARLYAESEQRAEHLAVLRELDQAITASLHTEDVYKAFAQQTLRLLPYDHMSIAMLEGDNIHAAYTTGKELVVPTGTRQSIKTLGMISLAIEQGQPILSGNIAADSRFVA